MENMINRKLLSNDIFIKLKLLKHKRWANTPYSMFQKNFCTNQKFDSQLFQNFTKEGNNLRFFSI